MSQTYSDLIETSFPDSVDTYDRFLDPDLTMYAAIKSYYAYVNAGDLVNANQILIDNPKLQRAIVNASTLNKLRDAIISLERYYFADIEDSIVNLVVYKGTWSASVAYSKYNVVNYTFNGITTAYMNIALSTPVSTLPTNTDYWIQITLQGEPGASGTGLAPRGVYDAATTYNVDDLVTFNNSLWVCTTDGIINQTPMSSSTYWYKLLAIDSTLLTYDNASSGLASSTIQDAIDELAGAKLSKTGGTLTGMVVASSTDNDVPQIHNIYAGTTAMVDGTTALATGVIYVQYNN